MKLALAAAVTALGGSLALAQPERRQIGNAVLDGVPEIPAETTQRLHPYQNVRSAGFADWLPGGGVLVATRFASTAQLHAVEQPMGARQQLTFFADPVTGAAFGSGPTAHVLLLAKDTDGNEETQLHLMDTRTGAIRQVTDGRAVYRGPRWSTAGDRIAFTSNRRNKRDWDVWVMTADGGEPRLLFEANGSWSVLDWSPDDTRLLVSNYTSISESALWVCDVATGKLEEIRPVPEGPVSFGGAAFARDGSGIYYICDNGGEFRSLWFRGTDGKATAIVQAATWDVEDFDLSADGTTLAHAINRDGYSVIAVRDLATGKEEAVPLPAGVVGRMKLSADGTRLALGISTFTSPGDVYTWDRAAKRLDRWTRSEVGGLPADAFIDAELVRYPTFDTAADGTPRQIPAYISRPAGDGPFPVVIDIHGGPESQRRPGFSPFSQYLLRELGIAVIEPNVRGSTGYGRAYHQLDNGMLREDSVRDIGALLDWIATQPDLDKGRVVVVGRSYGGYMVLASLMHYSDRLAGGVNTVGISNFVTFLESTAAYRRYLRRMEYGDESNPAMREFLESISPTRNTARIQAPLMVAQGYNDPRVPYTEAEQIVRAVRENGREVWYMLAMDEGHSFGKKENNNIHQALMSMFLEKVLTRE